MADFIGIIGIIVSVLLAIVGLLLGIIGYFFTGRLRSIDGSLKCLPEIQVELAGMKVRVEQQSEKQGKFCDLQTIFSERLTDVEKHISNQERMAVLEESMKTIKEELSRLRVVVHVIPTLQQAVTSLKDMFEMIEGKNLSKSAV